MISRILIKHLVGSKAHQIEQFHLDETHELLIGRGPAADVAFDGRLDDTVSRRHARIAILRGDRLALSILDLGSRNGIRINGECIVGEQIFLPGDVVALGPNGPAFSVALEPESLPVARDKTEALMRTDAGTLPARGRRLRFERFALWASLVVIGFGAGIVLDRLTRNPAGPHAAPGVPISKADSPNAP